MYDEPQLHTNKTHKIQATISRLKAVVHKVTKTARRMQFRTQVTVVNQTVNPSQKTTKKADRLR